MPHTKNAILNHKHQILLIQPTHSTDFCNIWLLDPSVLVSALIAMTQFTVAFNHGQLVISKTRCIVLCYAVGFGQKTRIPEELFTGLILKVKCSSKSFMKGNMINIMLPISVCPFLNKC